MNPVNLADKFSLIRDFWSPGIVGELNGQYVKLAKFKGEMIWHQHDHEDELFLVVKGAIKLELPDGEHHVREGEFFIVPAGVQHKPSADEEAHVLLFEPKATAHTGVIDSALTKAIEEQPWL